MWLHFLVVGWVLVSTPLVPSSLLPFHSALASSGLPDCLSSHPTTLTSGDLLSGPCEHFCRVSVQKQNIQNKGGVYNTCEEVVPGLL